jgi:hypothetical protein
MYQNNERIQNSTISVGLIDLETYQKRFDSAEILKTLEEVPWGLITYPLVASRPVVTQNSDDRGYMTIGFINSYDAEKKEFLVTVLGKFVDQVSDFSDTVICPMIIKPYNSDRLIINKLVYGPEKSFEFLTKPREDRKDNRNNNRGRNNKK